jgi:predicted kinase
VSTLFLVVGLPGAGKTRTAIDLAARRRALRLSPDEWMIPLFGEPDAGGKRDILEGRLIWLSLEALKLDTSVVLDFGFWSRDERSALRWLADSVGATTQVIYLPIDPTAQHDRIQQRWQRAPDSTFPMTAADRASYRAQFQVPTLDELTAVDLDEAPPGRTWREWAAERWPSLTAR